MNKETIQQKIQTLCMEGKAEFLTGNDTGKFAQAYNLAVAHGLMDDYWYYSGATQG